MAKNNLIVLNRVGADAHYADAICPNGAYNGDVVVLGERNADGTYQVAANANVADLSMAIILHEDLGYKIEDVNMSTVPLEAGKPVRTLIPRKFDQISIPVANITATVTVIKGRFVVPKATKLPMEAKISLSTEAIAWVIEDIYTRKGVPMALLRCVKA